MKTIITLFLFCSFSLFQRLEAGDIKDIKFELAPNPSQGEFKIHVTSVVKSSLQIEIYSILGNKIGSTLNYFEGQPIIINLSNQPNGIYLIRITDGQSSSVKRVKIQH